MSQIQFSYIEIFDKRVRNTDGSFVCTGNTTGILVCDDVRSLMLEGNELPIVLRQISAKEDVETQIPCSLGYNPYTMELIRVLSIAPMYVGKNMVLDMTTYLRSCDGLTVVTSRAFLATY